MGNGGRETAEELPAAERNFTEAELGNQGGGLNQVQTATLLTFEKTLPGKRKGRYP